jgi:hypothetical protein
MVDPRFDGESAASKKANQEKTAFQTAAHSQSLLRWAA